MESLAAKHNPGNIIYTPQAPGFGVAIKPGQCHCVTPKLLPQAAPDTKTSEIWILGEKRKRRENSKFLKALFVLTEQSPHGTIPEENIFRRTGQTSHT